MVVGRLNMAGRLALTAWVAGLLFTVWGTTTITRSNADRENARLQSLADETRQRIHERFTLYEQGLRGTRGAVLAAGGAAVGRRQFELYADSRDFAREFPGARGFGFIRRVPREAEADFLASARAEGPADFRIREIEPHTGERYVIQYIYPLGVNAGATGLDVASESNRRAAAESAMRTGQVRVTAPITLVQASGQTRQGLLMLLPTYRAGAPLGTEVARVASTIGWSYAPLVVDEVIGDLGPSAQEIRITLTDGTDPEPFFTRQPAEAEPLAGLSTRRLLQVGGRQWTMQVDALPALRQALAPTPPALVAVGGVAGSSVLALLLYLALRPRPGPGGPPRASLGPGTGDAGLRGLPTGVGVFLRSRLARGAALAYGLAVLAVAVVHFQIVLDQSWRETQRSLDDAVDEQVARVERSREAKRTTLRFLASAPDMAALLRARAGVGADPVDGSSRRAVEQRLQALLRALLESEPALDRIAVVGVDNPRATWIALARRSGGFDDTGTGAPLDAPSDGFLDAALRAGVGEVVLSDTVLDRRGGVIVEPRRPVLHLATPLIDDTGRAVALLVATVGQPPSLQITDMLRSERALGADVLVTNGAGDLLVHPDPSRTFRFETGAPLRWSDEYTRQEPDRFNGRERWLGPAGPSVGAMATVVGNPDTPFGQIRYLAVLPESRLRAAAWHLTRDRLPHALWVGVVGGVMLYLMWVAGQRRLDALSQRARLAALVDQSGDAIIGLDRQGRVLSWNRGAERVFGHAATRAVGQPLQALIGPAEGVSDEQRVLDALQPDEQPAPLDLWRRHRDGHDVQVTLTLSPLLDASRRLIGASLIARDVTAEREAQRAVAQANERLEAQVRERTALLAAERERLDNILRGTNAGTWEWNVQTGETRFNERWAEIVGHRLEELQPVSIDTWTRFAHPDDLARSGALLDDHFQGRTDQYECEARMRHRDGRWVWVLDRGRVITWTDDGRPEWMFGTHQDITAAREAAQRLAESEALLDRTGRLAGVGGWQYEVADRRVTWSAMIRSLHEADESFEPSPRNVADFFPGAARDAMIAATMRPLREGQAFDVELPFVTARGNRRHVRLLGEPVFGDDGRVVRIVGALMDITARHTMEEELRRINALQQSILDNLPCGLSAFDADLRLVAWNQEFVDLLGFEALFERGVPTFEDIMRFNAQRGEYGDVDVEAHVAEMTAKARDVVAHQFERVRPNGVTIEVRGTPMPEGGFVTTYTDISVRKRAEQTSERNAALLRAAINAVGEAFVLYDPQDRLVFCNEHYLAIYDGIRDLIEPGVSFEALVRAGVERGMLAQAIGHEEDFIAQRMERHRADSSTLIQHLGDGRVVRVTERRLPDGHTVGFRFDITDLVRASESAEAAARAKGEFLANMSHEIRTPLHALIGLTHLLADTPLSDRQQQIVAKSQAASQSLLAIVNDVLDLAKIEAGKMPLETEPLAVTDLLSQMEALFGQQAEARGLALRVQRAPDLPEVLLGDALRLRQVLTNLVANALKFTPAGSVSVALRRGAARPDDPAGTVRLHAEVRDTGVGIAQDVQMRLFTPFSQADASTTRRHGGTGLGLSIVHHLVTLMGGDVGLDSAPGQGSVFWFDVPLRGAGPDALPPPAVAAAPGALHALIAHPDPAQARELMERLRAFGWVASAAADPAAVVAQMGGPQPPDAVLVAERWPGAAPLADLKTLTDARHPAHPTGLVLVAPPESLGDLLPAAELLADAVLGWPAGASTLFNAVTHAVVRRQGHANRLVRAPGGAEAVASRRALAGLRVLVVDDSDTNREIAEHLLAREGATVLLASSGREAVARLSAEPALVDAVLMDVQMPDMDGLAATRALRAQPALAGLPVLALTAGALAEERRRALEAGMNDFLTKPLEPAALVAAVRQAVEHATGRAAPVWEPPEAIEAPGDVPADWPLIEGVDLRQAAHRLGHDRALLRRALRRVVAEFGPMAGEAWAAVDRDALAARLHKLRGAAGTVSAHAVVQAAQALETAWHERDAEDALARRWGVLQTALARLAQGAAPWLDGDDWHDGAAAAPCDPAVVARLQSLLAHSDLDALAWFDAHAAGLRARFGDATMRELGRCLHDLDFPAAAALLAEIAPA